MNWEQKVKDKIEITKQQQAEIQKVLDSKIIPHENHKVFEVNLKDGTIKEVEYIPPQTTIYWWEALEIYHKKKIRTVNLNSPQSEIIRKENCIYISALNKRNAIKILERDFRICN